MSCLETALEEIRLSNPTAHKVLKVAVDSSIPYRRIHFNNGLSGLYKQKDTYSAEIKLSIHDIDCCTFKGEYIGDVEVLEGNLTLGGISFTLTNCVITKKEQDSCTLMVERVTKGNL